MLNGFRKLEAVRRHLRGGVKRVQPQNRRKRVQKNLSILEGDAARLKSLSARDGLSQAQLLGQALDAYEDRQAALKVP